MYIEVPPRYERTQRYHGHSHIANPCVPSVLVTELAQPLTQNFHSRSSLLLSTSVEALVLSPSPSRKDTKISRSQSRICQKYSLRPEG